MEIKLILSQQYKEARARIMEEIVDWAVNTDSDAIPILAHFRQEERNLKIRIKLSPLSAGIDFPKPVKKSTSHSGKYVILYTYLPPDSQTNPEIKQVNLDDILPTATYEFGKLVDGLKQADLDE